MLKDFLQIFLFTLRDVSPILGLIIFFQVVVLKRPIPHLRRVITGGIYVVYFLLAK